ncbi:hypothetical protein, partial [Streptomyces sp. UH6]|uniref:hypothetical protein n=1 Tax=Streptomyces sp. UH6 TaxID=2748379 RepID=UPI0015D508B1
YAAALLTHLPLLGVLLLPWGRSRYAGGGEALMGLVTLALTAAVVTAVVYAPALSARVAPASPDWLPGRARRSVARFRRGDRRAHLLILGELVVLYVTAQCLGGLAGVVRPYVRDNPAPVVEAGGHPWDFHYGNFAVQAVVLYLGICFATTWYACRLRDRVTGAHT